jgi:hypothetical protein
MTQQARACVTTQCTLYKHNGIYRNYSSTCTSVYVIELNKVQVANTFQAQHLIQLILESLS